MDKFILHEDFRRHPAVFVDKGDLLVSQDPQHDKQAGQIEFVGVMLCNDVGRNRIHDIGYQDDGRNHAHGGINKFQVIPADILSHLLPGFHENQDIIPSLGKGQKQRMRLERRGLELRMELDADEKRVLLQLDNLD